MAGPAERFHADHAAQPETSQARQGVVCYERIVDFPAFPYSTDGTRRRSYSSWYSDKSGRSNGRHIRSRFLAVIRRAFSKEAPRKSRDARFPPPGFSRINQEALCPFAMVFLS